MTADDPPQSTDDEFAETIDSPAELEGEEFAQTVDMPDDPDATVHYESTERNNSANDQDSGDSSLPDVIGRYAVRKVLGKGGFGCVYLADDLD